MRQMRFVMHRITIMDRPLPTRHMSPSQDPHTRVTVQQTFNEHARTMMHQLSELPIRPADDHGAFPATMPLLPVPEVPPIVLDTNVLRADLLYSIKNQRRTALVNLTNSGVIRLFVAPHVLAEMEEHGTEWAIDLSIDTDEFFETYRYLYLPLLRCTEVSEDLLTKDEAERLAMLARIDPDDVPSATLARLLVAFYLS